MADIVYEIVKHDHGWAYKVGETFSEAYPSHDEARRAAEAAAARQEQAGDATTISFQDSQGEWHEERSDADDRPSTHVEG